jgi:hypothetical protein
MIMEICIVAPYIIDPNARYLEYVNPDGSHVCLNNNPSAKNPTFAQVAAFIEKDQTDKIKYKSGEFVCSNFAETLHNNAESEGLRCAWVAIEFSNTQISHSCNAFNTSDRGLIFVDCTSSPNAKAGDTFDTITNIKIGKQYQPKPINNDKTLHYPPLGIVKSCSIFW